MIQDLMRKHRTALLWIILLLVIVPFVYWGGYSGLRRYRRHLDHEEFPPVAYIGNVPIPQQLFRSVLAEELNKRRQLQPDITYRDLHEDGTAMEILTQLVNRTIIDIDGEATNAKFPEEFLIEEMKKLPQFQKDGKFNPTAWNEWIDARQRHNWRVDYAAMTSDLRRRLLLERVLAPVRVAESDVRKTFEEEFTRLRVRYVAVAPKIEFTEEQLQAFYESHRDKYQTPEKRKAIFVAFSIKPPKPPIVDELVKRARAGEDFAELAKQYSDGPDKESGGDMGWKKETPIVLDHYKPLFQLKPGEVSDPREGYGGYYIFKVDEERGNREQGTREVKARQIFIRAVLSDEEKQARQEQASKFAAQARETGDLRTAATAAGLEAKETDLFSEESVSIENIPNEDVWAFRTAVMELTPNQISDPIEARNNLYVAVVTEVEEPVQLSFDQVRERVERDARTEKETSEEYRQQLKQMTDDIKSKAKSINDILHLYPEEGFVSSETDWFNVAEFTPGAGPMWRPRDVFDAVGRGEPGIFGGPVEGYDGKMYFVELIAKEPPDEKVFQEKYEEQSKLIRQRLLSKLRQERIEDYFQMRTKQLGLRINQEVYDEILELNAPAATPEENKPEGQESNEASPTTDSADNQQKES